MKRLLTLVLLFGAFLLTAQKEAVFNVQVSTDSVLMDNYFEVRFTLENANSRQFSPPLFENFQVLAGPNTSSSMSIVNGEVNQSITYSYYLKPNDIGSYYIAPASMEIEGQILESEPLEISIYPNPDGIIQTPPRQKSNMLDPFDNDFFKGFDRQIPPPKPPTKKGKKKKKKRAVKRV